ncbi:MAG: cupredoxin domain-containing protein [Bacteroidia bacterium]
MKSFLLLLLICGAICSCKKAANPPANEVYMQNKKFYPNQLIVPVGTTVKWTDKDALKYTVTSNNNLFDSGKMDKDNTFSYTFSIKGTYNYYSNTYANMTGIIVVQ